MEWKSIMLGAPFLSHYSPDSLLHSENGRLTKDYQVWKWSSWRQQLIASTVTVWPTYFFMATSSFKSLIFSKTDNQTGGQDTIQPTDKMNRKKVMEVMIPLSRIFLMLRAIDVQFHRWCLNWCSHSLNPMLIPRLISRIKNVSFLHISEYLSRSRRDFLHIKYGSSNRLLPSALKMKRIFALFQ